METCNQITMQRIVLYDKNKEVLSVLFDNIKEGIQRMSGVMLREIGIELPASSMFNLMGTGIVVVNDNYTLKVEDI